jgi:hypothetical protein
LPEFDMNDLTRTELPSHDIPVHGWREILVWPLALDRGEAGTAANEGAAVADNVAKAIASDPLWARIDDPLAHAAPGGSIAGDSDVAEAFAEFVYFHDFIQRSMFTETRDPASTKRTGSPLYLFRRTNIRGARFTLLHREGEGAARQVFRDVFDFAVDRINLYLFRTGAAVLVVELEWRVAEGAVVLREGPLDSAGDPPAGTAPQSRKLTLADVLTLRDRLRRAYAPFFEINAGSPPQPGLAVERVSWTTNDGRQLGPFYTRRQWQEAMEMVQAVANRRPAVYEHWSELLPSALVPQTHAPGQAALQPAAWRHIVDERIPNLTWLSLSADDPADQLYRGVSRGDWVRLCFVDEAGSAELPYDETFLKDFEREHCYDRFYSGGTRYLFAGHSLSVVGHGPFFDVKIQRHFRRIYFDMALIAQFEYASLLAFSNRISRAVELRDVMMDDERFSRDMTGIQAEFLQFVHRFRPTGISNQMQGREMFNMLRKHLDLDRLFTDLQTEITSATAFLRAQEQQLETQATSRLSVVATVGATMGLAFTLLGMNVLFSSDMVNAVLQSGAPITANIVLRHVAVLMFTMGLFSTIMHQVLKYFELGSDPSGRRNMTQERLETLLVRGGVGLILTAIPTFLLSYG